MPCARHARRQQAARHQRPYRVSKAEQDVEGADMPPPERPVYLVNHAAAAYFHVPTIWMNSGTMVAVITITAPTDIQRNFSSAVMRPFVVLACVSISCIDRQTSRRQFDSSRVATSKASIGTSTT